MLKLAHLGIVVKNCEDSCDFYCKYLHCVQTGSWHNSDIKAIELQSGSLMIELLEYLAPKTEIRKSGIYDHLAFQTENIEETIKQLKTTGAAFETAAPRELANGKKIIFFRGPDGERIELVEAP